LWLRSAETREVEVTLKGDWPSQESLEVLRVVAREKGLTLQVRHHSVTFQRIVLDEGDLARKEPFILYHNNGPWGRQRPPERHS
jgi:hypothetical protein